jgi:hypothetical protein
MPQRYGLGCDGGLRVSITLSKFFSHVGLSLPRETPTYTVLGYHKSVHQFLVQPIGDLLTVVEEDLLDLDLAGGRLLAALIDWRLDTNMPSEVFGRHGSQC